VDVYHRLWCTVEVVSTVLYSSQVYINRNTEQLGGSLVRFVFFLFLVCLFVCSHRFFFSPQKKKTVRDMCNAIPESQEADSKARAKEALTSLMVTIGTSFIKDDPATPQKLRQSSLKESLESQASLADSQEAQPATRTPPRPKSGTLRQTTLFDFS
jgi:cbb3-type cytochrome oxidase subunit 3